MDAAYSLRVSGKRGWEKQGVNIDHPKFPRNSTCEDRVAAAGQEGQIALNCPEISAVALPAGMQLFDLQTEAHPVGDYRTQSELLTNHSRTQANRRPFRVPARAQRQRSRWRLCRLTDAAYSLRVSGKRGWEE